MASDKGIPKWTFYYISIYENIYDYQASKISSFIYTQTGETVSSHKNALIST